MTSSRFGRRGELTFSVNQFCALLALGLCLLGHRAKHRFGEIDLLDLDILDFHTPRLGVLVEDGLDPRVELVAMRQQPVQLDFAEDRSKRGLRKLRSLIAVVEHFHDRAARLDHAQEDDGVDFQRDVVARDDVLRRHLERLLPQRHAHDAVDRREDEEETRPLRLGQQPPEPENHAALVLGKDLDRAQQVEP